MDARIKAWLQHEAAGGVVLALAAAVALGISNSPLAPYYDALVRLPGEVRIGSDWLVLSKPLVVWVNELWMAVFFFLVGLEIKAELREGQLASPARAAIPLGAALGGMAVPALIYAAINQGDALALRGWAIPTATDIAFSLGVMQLLGKRVPATLKVFLTAVAVIDDLGAIIVIAAFYSSALSMTMLAAAGLGVAVLALLNRLRVVSLAPYVLVGLVVWLCLVKSGIHATLAGVCTALFVPLRRADGSSPVHEAAHALKNWVAFLVLPAFAFLNAGVPLAGVGLEALREGIPLGIILGLVVGKTLGVGSGAWLLMALTRSGLPAGASVLQFVATCVLCGIGFTMSLFIGGLGFENLPASYEQALRLGVLGGSLVAASFGTVLFLLADRLRQRHG